MKSVAGILGVLAVAVVVAGAARIASAADGAGASSLAAGASHYRIAKRIPVEGDGFWDLLAADASSGRVFLSHGTVVQIVDPATERLVGTIPDANGVHGVAVASELNKGFATCGKDTTVVIFKLDTAAVEARVRVTGENPDAILYEPTTKRVFAFSGRSANATVLDAASGAVVGTVALAGKPELPATDGAGKVFVNFEDKSEVCEIDAKTLTVEHTWPLAPGEEPSGLALDAAHHRLFSGCANHLMVVLDSDSGKVVATLPIGDHVDGVAFDPGLRRAYSSNGEGTLTVIQEAEDGTFSVLENVVTQKGARTLAVDPKTHRIFLPTAELGEAPKPTPEIPHPRPTVKPGSFVVLVVEPTP